MKKLQLRCKKNNELFLKNGIFLLTKTKKRTKKRNLEWFLKILKTAVFDLKQGKISFLTKLEKECFRFLFYRI